MNRLLITYRDVEALSGPSRRLSIDPEMGRGQFPLPVKVGLKAVRWVESEIRDWIKGRITEDRERRAEPGWRVSHVQAKIRPRCARGRIGRRRGTGARPVAS